MAELKIPPEEAIARIADRIEAIHQVAKKPDGLDYYGFIRWCSKTWQAIDEIYGPGDPRAEELRLLSLQNCSCCSSSMQALMLAEAYQDRLLAYIREIKDTAGI